jgi:hypothetical protein
MREGCRRVLLYRLDVAVRHANVLLGDASQRSVLAQLRQ